MIPIKQTQCCAAEIWKIKCDVTGQGKKDVFQLSCGEFCLGLDVKTLQNASLGPGD